MTPTQQNAIATEARKLVGTPYIWGGDGTPGVDCSGHAQLALKLAGVAPWAPSFPRRLDMTADQLWTRCIPIDAPEVGCLAFYGPRSGPAGHVVVVTEVDKQGRVTAICGASKGNAQCRTVADAKRLGAFVRERHGVDAHLYRPDFLGLRRAELKA